MKNTFFLLFTFLVLGMSQVSFAQGVAINITGNPPDPSAGLDVSFPDKGFLPPRVQDLGDIQDPAAGLIAYQLSDSTLNYYNDSVWIEISGCKIDTLRLNSTSFELLNLNSLPKKLLSGPGIGKYTKVFGVDIKFNPGTTPYEAGGTLYVYSSLDGTPPVFLGSDCAFFSNQNFLTKNFSSVKTLHPAEGESLENSSIWLISDGPITAGDGTAEILLFFMVTPW